ncbi:MAG: hypothetical protein HY216_11930 [Candidatus Rokubacteria bacterium]|nr:hypothetical protein [Candidatus Rokubacteria bacterium]
MKARVFGLAAILGALGAGFCCLGPVIFSALGVSALVSLTALRWVVPYRNVFFGLTLIALGLATRSIIAALFAYTISIEGPPRLW